MDQEPNASDQLASKPPPSWAAGSAQGGFWNWVGATRAGHRLGGAPREAFPGRTHAPPIPTPFASVGTACARDRTLDHRGVQRIWQFSLGSLPFHRRVTSDQRGSPNLLPLETARSEL